MKRSEINAVLVEARKVFQSHNFHLPQWAYRSPAEWKQAGPESQEIKDAMLGWDITDFGLGDFRSVGLLLFTLRNANLQRAGNAKTYAEKIMFVQPQQVTPMHFHWTKMEDIINRGGGELVLRLYNSLPDEELDKTSEIKVSIDGILQSGSPGRLRSPAARPEHHSDPRPVPRVLGRKDHLPDRRGVDGQR